MSAPYISAECRQYYTLVLDLDETLIHYDEDQHKRTFEQALSTFTQQNGRYPTQAETSQIMPELEFKVRPFCLEFIEAMSQMFEIVVFTAAEQQYADEVLDRLDPTGRLISHRLYRQHVTHIQNTYTGQLHLVKDLSKIGRPLERVIIVDNVAANFQWQADNGVEILSWYEDASDCEL